MILVGKYPSINFKDTEYSMFLKFNYDATLVEKVKSLPARRYIPSDKVWEIPIADIDRVVNLFGIDNLKMFNDFPEFDEYIKSIEVKRTGKQNIEELREYYRNLKPEVDYNFKTKPDGHQIESFNKALHLNSLFITDVMGLGKSKQSIDIMDYKKSVGLCNHVLIICGVNSLKYNWVEEIKKHSWYNCQVIDGPKKKRLEKINNFWMFYYNIINIESLRDPELVDVLASLCNKGYINGIIVDEFHKANNHKSKQGEGLRQLSARYKIALSGTPITKKIDKSWSILNWMGLESASYWKFKSRYCILGGYSGYDVVGYQNLDELHARFDKYQIRRTKDILCLPPKTRQTVYVEMTTEEHNEYMQLKRGIMRDLESGDTTIINPVAITIRLRQFTDKVKLRAIKETIEELAENDQPCVIFSTYKEALYMLIDEIKDYNPLLLTGDITDAAKKQAVIRAFQEEKKSNVLVGTIQAMGTGYTLTRSQYVLFLNKSWTVTDNEQAEDRCHRRGTTGNVTIISFIVKNTIDERVEEILENDKTYIDKVIDGVPIFKVDSKTLLNKLMED